MLLSFTYGVVGTEGPGSIQIWFCAAARGSSHRSDISWPACLPQTGLRAVAVIITSFGPGLPNISILPAVWMPFLFGMTPRLQTDASNCVHVSFVLSLMDYSPGEVLVCGRLPHDLLLGWHFSFIIAYPIGKISQLIQVSKAPNAKRVEADKTTCNMVWRAEAFAEKLKQEEPKNWIPEYRIRLCKMSACFSPWKGEVHSPWYSKTEKTASFCDDRTKQFIQVDLESIPRGARD